MRGHREKREAGGRGGVGERKREMGWDSIEKTAGFVECNGDGARKGKRDKGKGKSGEIHTKQCKGREWKRIKGLRKGRVKYRAWKVDAAGGGGGGGGGEGGEGGNGFYSLVVVKIVKWW